jgi:hypothetical protein
MFLMSLQPEAHCNAAFFEWGDGVMANAEADAVEVGPDGR